MSMKVVDIISRFKDFSLLWYLDIIVGFLNTAAVFSQQLKREKRIHNNKNEDNKTSSTVSVTRIDATKNLTNSKLPCAKFNKINMNKIAINKTIKNNTNWKLKQSI